MNVLWVVILAGGRGERFWPKSLRDKPKQFHSIVTERTMLQETFHRVFPGFEKERIRIVADEALRSLVREQLPEIDEKNFIAEPSRKNTAPAIGLAAAVLLKEDPDAVLAVLTADHVVKPREEYLRAIRAASRLAEEGYLVTFGILPDRPATEYGYIEIQKKMKGNWDLDVYSVKIFREKPTVEQALTFLERGGFLWNSGLFCFKAKSVFEAMKEHLPAMHAGFMRIHEGVGTAGEKEIVREEYEKFERISIDYGVMEKAKNIVCVRPKFSWDDVGSWSALARHRQKDIDGNVVEGDTVIMSSRNNIILGDCSSVIALIGVHDLVVVKEGERILICPKSQDQHVREALRRMAADEKLHRFL
jgi:mannose-1-phosphate guanylyltransferase